MPDLPHHHISTQSSRTICEQCLRVVSSCICQWVNPLSTDTHVSIVQHPHEKKQLKGTGRLLHLCLPNSQLTVDEHLSENTINQILSQRKRTVLLYPASPDHITLRPEQLVPQDTQLLVLDGTWRKSRKLLYLNPAFNQLPRLLLPAPLPTSLYRIRKAENDQQLSTLEATAYALSLIEPNKGIEAALLDSFKEFIRQIEQQQQQYTLE